MLEKIIALLKEQEGAEGMVDYLKGLKLLTPEGVREYLETPEGLRLIQPKLDKYYTTGLETWKANNLDKLVEELHNKKYPPKDEREKEIEELRIRLDKADRERERERLRNAALAKMVEKKLPVELIDRFIGEDDATTSAYIEEFEKIYTETVKAQVDAEVEKRFKENGRGKPGDDKPDRNEVNPWKKETFNLTLQGQIVKSDPEKAARLKAEAGIK
jgi:hypothetical protein